MTLTGSLGLSFMFLVDFLALWWISQLGEEVLISAVGFAGTIQFFVISISIGMMIGAVAMVSRALGQRDQERARAIGTSSIIYAVSGQLIIATLAWVFRREILVMTGAEGQALEEAIKFLTISLPSLPLIAAGMNASAILRAEGDAQAAVLRADGEAAAIKLVFDAVHAANPDEKVLAYQYLQQLPAIANGTASKIWVIPAELSGGVEQIMKAFKSK